MADDSGRLFVRDPKTLWRDVLDGVLVMAPDSTEAWHVSTPGDVVWSLLREPHTVEEIAATLAEAYGETTADLVGDIESVLQTLHKRRALLRIAESGVENPAVRG